MFSERIGKSQVLVDMFRLYCSSHGLEYIESGIERHPHTKRFMDIIRKMDGEYIKVKRYFVDFMVLNRKKELWLMELKASLSIERDAYESYVILKESGLKVGIVFLYQNGMQLAELSEIKLMAANLTDCPFDGIWASPRLLAEKEYKEWLSRHKGSGTPFALIDIEKTKYITLLNKVWNPDGELFDCPDSDSWV